VPVSETRPRKHRLFQANADDDEEQEVEAPTYKHVKTVAVPPPSCSSHWVSIAEKVASRHEKEEARRKEANVIRKRIEVARDQGWGSVDCQGDKRLRDIQRMLESGIGITRSPDQVLFHTCFILACLPKIYGEQWNDHSLRVMKEFEVDKIDPEVLIVTARRWGKTYAVAMFVVALLLCVPGIQIAIFSTGSRASGSLYDIVMMMISRIPDGFNRIVKNTKEHLFVACRSLPKGVSSNSVAAQKVRAMKDTSRMYAFPDSVKGNKKQSFF
jgi:hypothetical protein